MTSSFATIRDKVAVITGAGSGIYTFLFHLFIRHHHHNSSVVIITSSPYLSIITAVDCSHLILKGIGAATAHMFANEGAIVVIVDRNTESAAKVLSEIEEKGGKGLVIPADVSKEIDMKEVFKKVDEVYHKLDILVSNAGSLSYLFHKLVY